MINKAVLVKFSIWMNYWCLMFPATTNKDIDRFEYVKFGELIECVYLLLRFCIDKAKLPGKFIRSQIHEKQY